LQTNTSTSEMLDDRISQMKDHMKNVEQELKQNLALIEAHGKEISSEEHMFMIAEREDGRLKQENLKTIKQMEETHEKRNNLENRVFGLNQQLEDVKKQVNWEQQALEAWLEESARRDEDALTLQKYSKSDNSKLKSLSLQIDKLTEECQKKRLYLEQEATETHSNEQALDKAAEEFRLEHADRKHLIEEWEKTIEHMLKRDREINASAAELGKVKEEVRAAQVTIREKQAFLERERLENAEITRNISYEERHIGKMRQDLQDQEHSRDLLQDELDTLRFTVERTASDLLAIQSSIKMMQKDIQLKNFKLEKSAENREKMQHKMEQVTEDLISAEEKSKLAEKIFDEEEQLMYELNKKLTNAKAYHFKMKQETLNLESYEKTLSAQMQGVRSTNKNMDSRLRKLDKQAIQQQEIVYNQDFMIQQLQRRLAKLEGEADQEDKEEWEEKIRCLEHDLDERKNVLHTTILQLQNIRVHTRLARNGVDKITKDKDVLINIIHELELHNDMSIKAKNKIVASKHDLMVNNNILKLDLHRAQENFEEKADDVFNLEKQNQKLKTAMKERQQEIKLHRDMLNAQIKSADEERSNISMEVHQRAEKINKLKKKHEIFMVSMKSEDGEEKSAAYYVIKAAQEKEELQRKGDNLDAKIRKSEKEIRALENTLKLLNSRNETLRKGFSMVTETSEDFEKKQTLENQLRSVMDTFKYKRRQIKELQEDLQTISSALDTQMRDESAYQEMNEDRRSKIKQLNKDLSEQQLKLDRVQKQLGKYTREVRSRQGRNSPLMEETDMEVREMREKNRQLCKSVAAVVQQV